MYEAERKDLCDPPSEDWITEGGSERSGIPKGLTNTNQCKPLG